MGKKIVEKNVQCGIFWGFILKKSWAPWCMHNLGMGNACFFQSINFNQLLAFKIKINQFIFNYLLSKCPHDNSLTSIALGHGQPLWLPLMGKWTLHVDMGKFLDMAEIGSWKQVKFKKKNSWVRSDHFGQILLSEVNHHKWFQVAPLIIVYQSYGFRFHIYNIWIGCPTGWVVGGGGWFSLKLRISKGWSKSV